MALIVCEDHVLEIGRQAQEAYPHECCGFLIGTATGNDAVVTDIHPATNTRDDSPRNRFAIDPAELFRIDRAARKDGNGVIGFYHSHPDAPARPSAYDREHAWCGYSYLIVSVESREVADTLSWRLTADESEFEPEEIRIETEA